MQVIGSVTDGMPSYKIIYGTQSQIVNACNKRLPRFCKAACRCRWSNDR